MQVGPARGSSADLALGLLLSLPPWRELVQFLSEDSLLLILLSGQMQEGSNVYVRQTSSSFSLGTLRLFMSSSTNLPIIWDPDRRQHVGKISTPRTTIRKKKTTTSQLIHKPADTSWVNRRSFDAPVHRSKLFKSRRVCAWATEGIQNAA